MHALEIILTDDLGESKTYDLELNFKCFYCEETLETEILSGGETQTQSEDETQYFIDEDKRQFEEPFYLNGQYNYIRGGRYRKFVIKATSNQR